MKRSRTNFGDIVFRTTGILLLLTLMSVWLVNGLLAKFIVWDSFSDSARVAKGLPTVKIEEHEPYLDNGIYKLGTGTTKEYQYKKVIPGVDIPKDPYVTVGPNVSEVNFELFVKVIEENFPTDGTVKYEIDTDVWKPVPGKTNVYKYSGTFPAAGIANIYIIKNNELIVSQYYQWTKTFTLKFEAWMQQVD